MIKQTVPQLQDIPVAEVKIHTGYSQTESGFVVNDIMLVKLSRPAEYNKYVQPVCLPKWVSTVR